MQRVIVVDESYGCDDQLAFVEFVPQVQIIITATRRSGFTLHRNRFNLENHLNSMLYASLSPELLYFRIVLELSW